MQITTTDCTGIEIFFKNFEMHFCVSFYFNVQSFFKTLSLNFFMADVLVIKTN